MPAVLVSFVLRLHPDQLATGELVGEVEHVESGVVYPLRGAVDLLGHCQQAASPDRPRADVDRRDVVQ